jgi:hypothetical protein
VGGSCKPSDRSMLHTVRSYGPATDLVSFSQLACADIYCIYSCLKDSRYCRYRGLVYMICIHDLHHFSQPVSLKLMSVFGHMHASLDLLSVCPLFRPSLLLSFMIASIFLMSTMSATLSNYPVEFRQRAISTVAAKLRSHPSSNGNRYR